MVFFYDLFCFFVSPLHFKQHIVQLFVSGLVLSSLDPRRLCPARERQFNPRVTTLAETFIDCLTAFHLHIHRKHKTHKTLPPKHFTSSPLSTTWIASVRQRTMKKYFLSIWTYIGTLSFYERIVWICILYHIINYLPFKNYLVV